MKIVGRYHGFSKTPEYLAWKAMRWRCNPKNKHSKYYAKGILVTPEWDTFPPFLAHIGPMPKQGLEVDRKNGALGYIPGNVRWANRRQQMANTVTALKITIGGRTECASEWARLSGLPLMTVIYRVHRKWPECEILSSRKFKHRKGRLCA